MVSLNARKKTWNRHASSLINRTARTTYYVLGLTALLWANVAASSYALNFPDTGDRGAPSSTAGGGTRGGWCEEDITWADTSLFALVPKNNVSTFAGEQASLWIHMAAGLSQNRAEIFVQNAQTHEVVYQKEMTLESFETNHTMQLNLPATNASGEPLLNADQTYKWEFAVICDDGDRARDYYINGLIQPITAEATLSAQLATASIQDRAELYANAGIWQETLMIARQLEDTQPTLLAELLASVDLGDRETVLSTAWIETSLESSLEASKRHAQ